MKNTHPQGCCGVPPVVQTWGIIHPINDNGIASPIGHRHRTGQWSTLPRFQQDPSRVPLQHFINDKQHATETRKNLKQRPVLRTTRLPASLRPTAVKTPRCCQHTTPSSKRRTAIDAPRCHPTRHTATKTPFVPLPKRQHHHNATSLHLHLQLQLQLQLRTTQKAEHYSSTRIHRSTNLTFLTAVMKSSMVTLSGASCAGESGPARNPPTASAPPSPPPPLARSATPAFP